MSALRVRLLGGFEVWHGERQVEGFESQKVRALLAYLISHAVGRSAATTWPGCSGRSAVPRRPATPCARRSTTSARRSPPRGGPPLLADHREVRSTPRARLGRRRRLRGGAAPGRRPGSTRTTWPRRRSSTAATSCPASSSRTRGVRGVAGRRAGAAARGGHRRLAVPGRRLPPARRAPRRHHFARRLVSVEPLSEGVPRPDADRPAGGPAQLALAEYERLARAAARRAGSRAAARNPRAVRGDPARDPIGEAPPEDESSVRWCRWSAARSPVPPARMLAADSAAVVPG